MNQVQKLQLIGQLGSPCWKERRLAWVELYKQEQQRAYQFFFRGSGKLPGIRDEATAGKLYHDLYDKISDALMTKRLVFPNLNAYRSYVYKAKYSALGQYWRQRGIAYRNLLGNQDPPLVERDFEDETEPEMDCTKRHPSIFDQPSIRSNPRLLTITSLFLLGYKATQMHAFLPASYRTIRRDSEKIGRATRKMMTGDKPSIQSGPKSAEWSYPDHPGDLGLTIAGHFPDLAPHSERELRKLHGIKPDVAIGDVLMPFLIVMGIKTPERMVRMYFLEYRGMSLDVLEQDQLTYSEHSIALHQEKVKGKTEPMIDLAYNGEITAKLIDAKLSLDGDVNLLVMKYDLPTGPTIINKMMGGKKKRVFRQAKGVATTWFTSHPAPNQ